MIGVVLANNKVAVSVIPLVAVDVVNFCAGRQWLAERFLCDGDVFPLASRDSIHRSSGLSRSNRAWQRAVDSPPVL
jgi:hypothetical protein